MSRLTTIESHLHGDLFAYQERRGACGILYIRHRAPVPSGDGALTIEMRRSLLRYLRELQTDPAVGYILLTSDSPRVFSTGVNTEAFGDGIVEDKGRHIPSLTALCSAVESSLKPVMALVRGACQSWGLELAMAAPFRVADRGARFSFPEVQLGLVPCGGGAQRLTNLIGVRQALLMLCSGKTVTATEALSTGLIDAVLLPAAAVGLDANASASGSGGGAAVSILSQDTQPSVFEQAMALAAAYAAAVARAGPAFVPRARQTGRIGLTATTTIQLAWMGHKIRDNAPRSIRAPFKCLQAVRIAVRHAGQFARGLERERGLFLQCLAEAECKAMQHVLRASGRTVANWDREVRLHLTAHQQLRPFRHAAVVGTGSTGTSIAFLLLQHGVRVTVVETDAARRDAVRSKIAAEVAAAAAVHRRMSATEAAEALARFSVTGSHADPFPAVIAEADLLVECLPELATAKKNALAHLDKICNGACVFIASTASIDVAELAAVTRRPQQVAGMHFYAPANLNPLVELCRLQQTDHTVQRRLMALAEKLQKHVIVTQGGDGHVGTRVLLAGLYQAYLMLEEGSFPMEIDKILTEHFHFKRGIFQLEDLIGLDTTTMARQQVRGAPNSPLMPRDVYDVADGLVADGHLGRKRGEGWHRYMEVASANPEHDERDIEVPLSLPSLSANWNPLQWRSGQMLPPGQWQTLLGDKDLSIVHNRGPEHRLIKAGKEKRIMRRDFPAENEVVERILLAMANEAAKLLALGAASCAADIDCLSVHAFGFPAWKGGLLYYADHMIGVDKLIAKMRVYRNAIGADGFPQPCDALLEMARRHQTFATMFPAAAQSD